MEANRPWLRKPLQPANVELTHAQAEHMPFIVDLQKKFGEAAGFLPRAALAELMAENRIVLAWENGQPAGYSVSRPTLRWRPELSPIVQMCVCMDAQRRHIGQALLTLIINEATTRHQTGLQANCAVGVPANEFWSASGFVPTCHFSPTNRRRREIICWRLPLVRNIPLWFADPPAVAGFPPRPVEVIRNPTRSEFAIEIASRYITRRTTPRGNFGAVHAVRRTTTEEKAPGNTPPGTPT